MQTEYAEAFFDICLRPASIFLAYLYVQLSIFSHILYREFKTYYICRYIQVSRALIANLSTAVCSL